MTRAEAGSRSATDCSIRSGCWRQKHPHVKFLMSVGGWTDSGTPFYGMAASSPPGRYSRESCADF